MASRRGGVLIPISTEFNSKGLDAAKKELGAFGKQTGLSKWTVSIGASVAVAGAAITAFAADAVKAGSDLTESQSKLNVVFGQSAAGMTQWAGTAVTSMGMTTQAAMEAAGTYGNLFQAFGLTSDQAADMSKQLVQTAADLASFNNTSTEDALNAIRSALSGEAEPMKRYGASITDVRLKEEALAEGIYNGVGALNAAQKAQAAYKLILKDTALAQGDYSRTSTGFANTMKTLNATVEDVKAKLGVQFIKVIQDTIAIFGGPGGLSETLTTSADKVVIFTTGVDMLIKKIGEFKALTGDTGTGEGSWTDGLKAFGSAAVDAAANSVPAMKGMKDNLNAFMVVSEAQMRLEQARAKSAADEAAGMKALHDGYNYGAQKLNELAAAEGKVDENGKPVVDTLKDIGNAAHSSMTDVDKLKASLDIMYGRRKSLREGRIAVEAGKDDLFNFGVETVRGGAKKVKKYSADGKSFTWVTVKDAQGNTVMNPDKKKFTPPKINTRGNLALGTESGREASTAATGYADSTMAQVENLIAAGRADEALALLRSNRGVLRQVGAKWGVANPAAFARTYLPTPPVLAGIMRDQRAAGRTPSNYAGYVSGSGSENIVTNNYYFNGDLKVGTLAEAAKVANQAARLRHLNGNRNIRTEVLMGAGAA